MTLLAPWGPTEWTSVASVLLILGILLLAAEIFVIPGFGVVGVLGIASTIAGGAVAWTRLGPLWGVLAIAVSAAAAGFLLWSFPRTRLGKKFVLEESHAGVRAPAEDLASLLGGEGVAITMLRPSGTASIGDRRVDVVTDGVFVDANTRVRVIRVEGSRIVVEAC